MANMDNFPPNSNAAKEQTREPRVTQVTSAPASRRKKSLGKQFKETFVGGDMKSASHYVFFGVIIPSAQDMILEAMSSGFERLIRGDSRPRSRARAYSQGPNPYGHVAYNRMSQQQYAGPEPSRQISKRARAQHDFDEIELVSRQEAEEVIERLIDVISRYDSATVADLYELTGLPSNHTDHKWGWTNLRGASTTRAGSGRYLLNLPSPEPLS